MDIERIDVYKNLDTDKTKVYPKSVADAIYTDEAENKNILTYISEKIDENIDDTLLESGKAADSKAVGDKITELETDIETNYAKKNAIPEASASTVGGIKANTATSNDTIDVHINSDGNAKAALNISNKSEIDTDYTQEVKKDSSTNKLYVSLPDIDSGIDVEYDETQQAIKFSERGLDNDEYLELSGKYSTLSSELEDIRTGADGTEYDSAGDAVREQVSSLSDDLDDVVDGLQMYHINDFNKKDVTLDSYLGHSVGKSSMYDAPVSSGSGFVCNKIYKITKGDVIYTNNGSVIPHLYDSNGLFLERLTDESIKNKPVENEQAQYMKWQYGSKNGLDTIMINVGHPLPDDYVGYDAVSITTKETKELEERVNILENQEVANKSKCYVLLSFDDQTQMYADRFPIMKEYGFPFTFCLNSGFQDNNGFANDSEKQAFFEMLSYGCDVAQYHVGRNITGLGSDSTAEEWQNAISNLLDFINGYGIYPVTYFARQNVLYDNAITALKNLGFGIARSGMYSPENNYRWIESYDDERFNTPCYPVNATNLENCKKYLDDCVKNGWSIAFMTHRLTGADDNNCDETTFRTLMDYIKNYINQGKCEVVTYQNFLNYKTKKGKKIENLRKEKRLNWVQSKIN